MQSAEELFDPKHAGGPWECDLSDPYMRMVAWELVELAWAEEGENWCDETLDGKPFELAEPGPGVLWTRQEFALPSTGVLRLVYHSTLRAPRVADIVESAVVEQLVVMVGAALHDGTDPLVLVRMAAVDFYFAAAHAEVLVTQMRGISKAEAAIALVPVVVDPANLAHCVYDSLTEFEFGYVEHKLGPVLLLIPAARRAIMW